MRVALLLLFHLLCEAVVVVDVFFLLLVVEELGMCDISGAPTFVFSLLVSVSLLFISIHLLLCLTIQNMSSIRSGEWKREVDDEKFTEWKEVL